MSANVAGFTPADCYALMLFSPEERSILVCVMCNQPPNPNNRRTSILRAGISYRP